MTEEQVLMGRLRDLAKRAYEKNIYTYIIEKMEYH